MADQEMSEEKEANLPGIGELQTYSQQTLKTLVIATQKANSLPTPGADHDFYYSFSDFREFRNAEGTRLLDKAHDLLRHFHVRCGWPMKGKTCDSVDIDDLYENLVEANDIILEEVDTKLDEASGLSKNKNPIINKTVQSSKPVVSSWNRRSLESGQKSSPVRLLLAKNVTRPQMRFKDKIDNSTVPFVPILQHKPNGIKPLQKYTPDTAIPEDLSLPSAIADFVHQQRVHSATNRINHPYEYELQVFEPPETQLKEQTEQLYGSLEETPCTFITTVEQLEELSEKLNNVTEFAVDLEHHSYRSFQGFVCLMQVSTRDHDYLIDTLELRSAINILNDCFTNPKILKVFHGADMDIGWLQRDFGIYVVNMFDTGQASRVLSYERLSLSYLLKKFCDVSAKKEYQLADWRIRPLPSEMSQYAREDTHYLLYIYDRLRNELIKTGNAQNNLLLSVYKRSKEVCLKKYEKPKYTSSSYMNLYTKQRRPLNPSQLQVFKALHQWRDTIARQEDESCGYVLPNHMLFNIAESLPRESQGILACCNPIPPLVKQYVTEVHLLIQNAKDSQPTTPEVQTSTETRQDHSLVSFPSSPSSTTQQPFTDLNRNVSHGDVTTPSPIKPFEGYKPKGPKVETVRPVISLFDYPENKTSKLSKGLKKAKKILETFINPFQAVLNISESEISSDGNRPEQPQAKIDKINQNWKEKSNESIISKESTKDKSSGSDSNEEQDETTPLRQQISGTKRKKKQQQKTQDSESKKKKTVDDSGGADNEDHNPSYDTIAHKPKEFVPFDYSPGEYRNLEGSTSQSKTEIFNPYEQKKKQKGKNTPRSKVHVKSAQKSMTWSKGRSSQNKQQWPSR